jgi:glucose/arabinose dehydrogenase
MTRRRLAALAAMTAFAGVMLTACPKPNGYEAIRAFPQLSFGRMVALQPVPGDLDHALVVTQDGRIRRVNLANDAEPATVFLDISSRILPGAQTEEGLLGLAFAPDYAKSGKFYVYYTTSPWHNRVSRFTARGGEADADSEQVMLELPPKLAQNHNGGALAFGPDGYLYISVGDGVGGGDPPNHGQNTNTLFGKILRIDVSGETYTIPADNPFASGGGLPEIYAYGLRNPWRMNFDPKMGQLWAADAGQDRWEEVDRIVKGGNYGWNTMEGNHCYKPAVGCNASGMLPPRAEYSHEFGCVVVGGYVYRGEEMPELDGWYVYGDFCSGRVWAVDIASDAGAAIPLADSGAQIASFAEDKAGELYLLSFDNAVYKLVRKPG